MTRETQTGKCPHSSEISGLCWKCYPAPLTQTPAVERLQEIRKRAERREKRVRTGRHEAAHAHAEWLADRVPHLLDQVASLLAERERLQGEVRAIAKLVDANGRTALAGVSDLVAEVERLKAENAAIAAVRDGWDELAMKFADEIALLRGDKRDAEHRAAALEQAIREYFDAEDKNERDEKRDTIRALLAQGDTPT